MKVTEKSEILFCRQIDLPYICTTKYIGHGISQNIIILRHYIWHPCPLHQILEMDRKERRNGAQSFGRTGKYWTKSTTGRT